MDVHDVIVSLELYLILEVLIVLMLEGFNLLLRFPASLLVLDKASFGDFVITDDVTLAAHCAFSSHTRLFEALIVCFDLVIRIVFT